ncbi:1,4-dihydroxy-2-naphthoate polyprenyltransferase [Peribacillus deserti]|uniref:1,4-dihydroxy-2-naphthoate octaprenyltransferase n=1 Tax=Peribacillus deserti TaxID=673318 RepID=A0A2N5M4K9_9BACI|nr:1,4-dihydroxy-2-naphthoate polyprenyltransferase [Peribacillus deserti]PLT29306.1 1,4-dihydroxy-2-naphthoate octaprenyltransferase [Peribacillus deserti]
MHTHTQHTPLVKNNKNNWRVWWQLTRPHTLTAGFVPVLVGTALALNDDASFHIPVFICMMIATLFIQMATNMFNEYYDFKRGLDNENSIGIGGAIVREGVSPKTVLNIALSLYGLSVLLGIYICVVSSWWLALIGLICMAVGYLYTGGPLPIAYTPFGELFAGLFMGVFVILISFFIQAGYVSSNAVLVSIPVALLVGAINLSNNIRDLDGDKENGRKTLAILCGRKNAVIVLGSMMGVSYLWVIILIASGLASPWLLIVFFSVPKAVKAIKGFIGKTQPLQMMPAMKATAQTNTIFGFLLSIGLFISYFV